MIDNLQFGCTFIIKKYSETTVIRILYWTGKYTEEILRRLRLFCCCNSTRSSGRSSNSGSSGISDCCCCCYCCYSCCRHKGLQTYTIEEQFFNFEFFFPSQTCYVFLRHIIEILIAKHVNLSKLFKSISLHVWQCMKGISCTFSSDVASHCGTRTPWLQPLLQ